MDRNLSTKPICVLFSMFLTILLLERTFITLGERYVTSEISSKREESHKVLQLNARFTVTGAQKLGRGTPDTFLKKLNGDRKKTGESLEASCLLGNTAPSNVKNVHEKQDTLSFSPDNIQQNTSAILSYYFPQNSSQHIPSQIITRTV